MAYTPTTWHGGDVLSAEAMNKIEQGISNAENTSGVFIIIAEGDGNNYTLNKTYAEIKEAYISGKQCLIKYDDNSYCSVIQLSSNNIQTRNTNFSASTVNDYPSYSIEK